MLKAEQKDNCVLGEKRFGFESQPAEENKSNWQCRRESLHTQITRDIFDCRCWWDGAKNYLGVWEKKGSLFSLHASQQASLYKKNNGVDKFGLDNSCGKFMNANNTCYAILLIVIHVQYENIYPNVWLPSASFWETN